ncbi:DUF4359 domain-containing protein [Fodinisporobacter ferrooxydans]|uniref:DUF4359 domain-containing protein n=1 Tax=Fodinisporobacter ferrooxydans TaxID=2901836 RepID=A0ABY4CIX3_9BACL|nr:DUF4359 domain-containing protein [Alicyclobacillaceae bacterium MYW30-H2]
MFKIRNLVLIFGILILLAITNPAKTEYVSWIKEKAMEKSNSMLQKGLVSLLGDKMFENATKTQNYGVFTIFETDLEGSRVQVLGIFHNFIPLRKIESKTTSALF